MTTENLTPQESMKLIQSMINKARFNFSKGSFYFILWGLLLVAAAIYETIMLSKGMGNISYLAWPIVGVGGGIVSMIYGFRSERTEASSHLERMYKGIWLAYFFTLTLLIFALVFNQTNPAGYILIVTGLPTFLTGYLLKFKPLQLGGIAFWIFGGMSLFAFPEFATPIFAMSVALGYLIPGIMMRKIQSEDV